MELTQKQKRQLIIMLALCLALPIAIFSLAKIIELRTLADTKPNNVKVGNVGIAMFSVSWQTQDNALGKIIWGTSRNALLNSVEDDRAKNGFNATKKNHVVTVTTSTAANRLAYQSCDPFGGPCVSIYASPQTITAGQSVNLNYFSVGTDSNRITAPGFSQDVAPGSGQLTVNPTQTTTYQITGSASGTFFTDVTTVTVQQAAVSRIFGRVTDTDTGQGIPNVSIGITGGQSATTDAVGNYTFSNLVSGYYSSCINALPTGYALVSPASACHPPFFIPPDAQKDFRLRRTTTPSPGSFSLTATCSGNAGVRLQWSQFSGAASYHIQIGTSPQRNADGSLTNAVYNQPNIPSSVTSWGPINLGAGTFFAVVGAKNGSGNIIGIAPALGQQPTSTQCVANPTPPATASPTPPVTPTPPATASPTPPVTPTPPATASPTPPVTPTPTGNPSGSPTASPSGSGNPTASPSGSGQASASPTPQPSEPPVATGFTRIYYQIQSGDTVYGGRDINNLVANGPALFVDLPSQVAGAAPLADCSNNQKAQAPGCPDSAFGSVKDSSGTPITDTLISLTVADPGGQVSNTLFGISDDNGHYSVPLGNALTQDLRTYLAYNRQNASQIVITAITNDSRTQELTTTTATDKPLPDIVFASATTSPSASVNPSVTANPTASPTANPSGSANPSASAQASASPVLQKHLKIMMTPEGRDPATISNCAWLVDNDTKAVYAIPPFKQSTTSIAPVPQLITGARYSLTLKVYQYLGSSRVVSINPDETIVNFGTLTAGDIAPNSGGINVSNCPGNPPTDDLIEAALDYSTLKSGLTSQNLTGDLNGNSVVDVVDLSLLKKNLEKKGSNFAGLR